MKPSPPKVHVVDDDASILRALARLLGVAGHTVETFSSATAFLAAHGPQCRGCVLVDLRMPGMGGLELQTALAQSGNPLPVIFLTGHGDIPTSVHAMKDGAEDFLTKPVKKEELLKAVGRALARDEQSFVEFLRRKKLRQCFERLTAREREVLIHVIAGKLNKEIAADLGASERTIKAHRAAIMEKMQAQSPVELGRMAQELDLRAVV